MARGDKSARTTKQKRQVERIERSIEGRGISSKDSARRGGMKASSNESSSERSRVAKKSAASRR